MFEKYFVKAIEHLFSVYIASSKHSGGGGGGGLEEFSKVMHTLDYVSGLHNCLELSQPPCVQMRLCKHGKSAPLLDKLIDKLID